MAKTVKYWYSKIPYDYFEKHHMKIIRSFNDGLIKENLFFKMLIHSAKHEGKLRVNSEIPYSVNMIGSVFSTPVETVEEALEEFQKLGVLEILDDGTLFFEESLKLFGSESESAERVRKHRDQKDETLQCNTNVTTVRDRDRDRVIDKVKVKDKTKAKVRVISTCLDNALKKYDLFLSEEEKNKKNNSFDKNIDEEATDKSIEAYIDTAIKNEKIKRQANEVFEQCRDAIKEYHQVISSRFSTKEAKSKIESALKSNADSQEIITGYKNYLMSNKGNDIKYIKNFTVFMNQEIWKDFLDWEETKERTDDINDLRNQYFGD